MEEIFNEMKEDIQFLLIMLEAYNDDIGCDAWVQDDSFVELTKKYGFTPENLHDGFEYLFC